MGLGQWEVGVEDWEPAVVEEGAGVAIEGDVVGALDDGLSLAADPDHGGLEEEAEAVVGLGLEVFGKE